MKIHKCAFGEYQTNAYILQFNGFEFVVDPGYGATDWVLRNTTNLQAILITHGHFDHIWDTSKLQEKTQAKVYCPVQDSFMLESDCFNLGLTPCKADTYVDNNKNVVCLNINGVDVKYWHFPGHTPGCSIIEVCGHIFSGDFVFQRSIGRYDFPYSNSNDMKESLERFLQIKEDLPIHPGHGEDTSVFAESYNIPIWIKHIA
ncbi:MBL fold metallo-hydrolase [Helicobacter trogontum]|nr:MBL fold metallo-hydrolase [Helicobacter trogontum]MCI5787575.1 MBL fold metallo-hydrolase [Helicobacter trogontum]MDY5185011.1 MBL fold metallo-hydrolase [Helicobacter trogontum]TLD98448.1 MBL fold metallo-hydrolase [Helicobacter trogontum]